MVGQMPLVRSDAIAWSTWKRKGGLVNAILHNSLLPMAQTKLAADANRYM